MRRAQTSTITSQMYRHFATVTIILTVAVAFFANGEDEQASAAQAAANAAAMHKAAAAPVQPTLRDATGDGNAWDIDDGDSDDGQAIDALSPDSQPLPPPRVGIADASPSADNGDAAEAAGPTIPTAAQIAAAEAASRLRSGSAGDE